MKIKAYQIAPEYQEAPLLIDIVDDTVIITGNDRLHGHETEAYHIAWDAVYCGNNPCEEGEADFEKWEELIIDCSEQRKPDSVTFCNALELITGEKWNYTELRGTCQGDWNGCYYLPGIWTCEQIKALEMEYFNIGTEWDIIDEDDENWGRTYTHHWSDDENRKEIASVFALAPCDVKLYLFDGWTKTAKYEEA